jgi:hypothetical protein
VFPDNECIPFSQDSISAITWAGSGCKRCTTYWYGPYDMIIHVGICY